MSITAEERSSDAYEVISTVVDDWFDTYQRDALGSNPVEQLKQSLYAQVKLFKDLSTNGGGENNGT